MSNSAPHKVVMPDRCQDFFFGGGDWLWGLILTAQVFKFWCSFFPNNPPNQTISHTKQERKNTKKKHSKKSHQNHRLKPAQPISHWVALFKPPPLLFQGCASLGGHITLCFLAVRHINDSVFGEICVS